MIRILGIETSCDETAAAVVADGHTILSNVVASQTDLHAQYGGIFPEVASRAHVEIIYPIVREAMGVAYLGWDDLDAIAVMDRSISFGAMDNAGPLYLELLAALGAHDVRVPMTDYVYGLGGRDILPWEIERVFRDALDVAETGQIERKVTYLSVRE